MLIALSNFPADRSHVQVDLAAGSGQDSSLAALFAEELGLILEVAPQREAEVIQAYESAGVSVRSIGEVTESSQIDVSVGGQPGVSGAPMRQG